MDGIILTGRYDAKLDSMHRMVMPSQFRAQVSAICGGTLHARDMGGYLLLLPPQAVQRLLGESEADALLDEERRTTRRELAVEFVMLTMDVQGRVRLAEQHKALFDVKGEVSILGTGGEIEVWPKAGLARSGMGGVGDEKS
ncbi:hypothetical protein JW905_08070 [bacterium]|nr:hypothetical protein [candidate division CSSED10-310 bacterium]